VYYAIRFQRGARRFFLPTFEAEVFHDKSTFLTRLQRLHYICNCMQKLRFFSTPICNCNERTRGRIIMRIMFPIKTAVTLLQNKMYSDKY
jgi:hypothetical protein